MKPSNCIALLCLGIALLTASWSLLAHGQILVGRKVVIKEVIKPTLIVPGNIPRGFEFSAMTTDPLISVDWLDAIPGFPPCSGMKDKPYKETMNRCSEILAKKYSNDEEGIELHNFFIAYDRERNQQKIPIREVIKQLRRTLPKEYFDDR